MGQYKFSHPDWRRQAHCLQMRHSQERGPGAVQVLVFIILKYRHRGKVCGHVRFATCCKETLVMTILTLTLAMCSMWPVTTMIPTLCQYMVSSQPSIINYRWPVWQWYQWCVGLSDVVILGGEVINVNTLGQYPNCGELKIVWPSTMIIWWVSGVICHLSIIPDIGAGSMFTFDTREERIDKDLLNKQIRNLNVFWYCLPALKALCLAAWSQAWQYILLQWSFVSASIRLDLDNQQTAF